MINGSYRGCHLVLLPSRFALRVKVKVINEELLGKHLIGREHSRDLSMDAAILFCCHVVLQ